MAAYNFREVEKKWQAYWDREKTFKAEDLSKKPKYYTLDMFPYPSGAGLHVGHPLGYIASDIVARFKKQQGFNVLHPMGFDSFGLPAEQYAIQTGQHPAITTEQNIARYIEQLKNIGFAYDWDKEVRTSDPSFYKWTQWIFSLLFNSWYDLAENKSRDIRVLEEHFEKTGNQIINAACDDDTPHFTATDWLHFSEQEKEQMKLKYRIAYLSEAVVNWCPALGTVLSNDEVKDGFSERGGHPVERKKMMQWSMRISAFAERLLEGLNKIDWPEPVKEMQRNWIGKSVGAELDFQLAGSVKTATPNNNTKNEELKNNVKDPSLTPSPSGREASATYMTTAPALWEKLKPFARANRKNPTPEEDELWQALRNKQTGYKIRRQHAIGNYIVDFVSLEKGLVIEVDGNDHKLNKEYDELRSAYLNLQGFRVIRFWNSEVSKNTKEVILQIKKLLNSSPSPAERGLAAEVFENDDLSKPTDQKSEFSHDDKDQEKNEAIKVFTTRIDTIYGVTFMVLAPEHELVKKITTPAQKAEVEDYVSVAKNRSERERMTEVKRVSGAFTGAYAIHPFTKEEIPVWIGDYVLAGYGTGAVMAVPSDDERDLAFAEHYGLPVIQVIESGKIINSDFLSGLSIKNAIDKAIEFVEEKKIGKAKVNYRMRDAIFSRQRYWGEPVPVYFKEGIPYLLDEDKLPLELPEVDKYLPTEDGEPPLARAENWETDEGYALEKSTMPGWAGSSWYMFRYMDAHNNEAFVSPEKQAYWQNVDLYIGGSEHATGHLLYSRFWTKFLFDRGYLTVDEPFQKMINQGMIQGRSNFVYRIEGENKYVSLGLKEQYKTQALHVDVNIVKNDELDVEAFKTWRTENADAEFMLEDGKYLCGAEVEKMSKSKHNVVNPDDVIEQYGADTLRLYEMFLGPLEQFKPWNTNGIDGTFKFLKKFWKLFHNEEGTLALSSTEPDKKALKALHLAIQKVEYDIANFSFNTSVSTFMICVNTLTDLKCNNKAVLSDLIRIIAPYAPHICEELWEELGHSGSVSASGWPEFNKAYIEENDHTYPVSVNGKHRDNMTFSVDTPKEAIEKAVLENPKIQKWIEDKSIKKMIIVPNKIVNIVV